MICVDPLIKWGRPGSYPNSQAERVGARHGHLWCHLVSDKGPDDPELHALAARIGLRREWFQGDHYDLIPPKRAAALRAGAVEISMHEAAIIFRAWRIRRKLCKACGHVIALKGDETPPAACPKCGAGAPQAPKGGSNG